MNYKIAILAVIAVQAFTAHALPPCVCTRNLKPVCGSDGETYSNQCLLECEQSKGKADLTVAKEGPCEPAAVPICVCTYEYKPVCGTDGKTYSNRCSLLCERRSIPDIDVKSEGACADEIKVDTPCICTDELDPVCGTDGNTYDNPCLLNCATAKNSQLAIKHKGICDDRIRIAQSPCVCPRNLRPVCGSDGETYPNQCRLECARSRGKSDLTVAKTEPCDPSYYQPVCICTLELNEVCGTDGKTYGNECALNCETAKNPQLALKHRGKCDDSVKVADSPVTDQDCPCGKDMGPVCGSDGVTYNNACLLGCASAHIQQLTLARLGPC